MSINNCVYSLVILLSFSSRSVPRDAQIVGVGGAGGMATPTSPTPGQSQPIRSIPSPSSALYDRPSSPGVLGAVPWHVSN